jgi:hypothetical protein
MGYNAGLLGDAMRLDASDLNQRRNLASNEAQFAETANRGAGALNLQGGQALGQLAQAGTADERQRIADACIRSGSDVTRNQQDLTSSTMSSIESWITQVDRLTSEMLRSVPPQVRL